MRWRGGRDSDNVEDRRGEGMGGGPGFGGGGFRLPVGGRVGGFGVIALIILGLVFGVDPSLLLTGGGPTPSSYIQDDPAGARLQPGAPPQDEMGQFVAVVLGETEATWQAQFQALGRLYEEPRLVLFSGATRSACGPAQSATGPFYCPVDRKIYLDTSFFDEMRRRFGAPGDFAQAYIIAHEVGHHVQNLLGILPRVEAARGQMSQREANQVQVMVELQADCFAGLWAHDADQRRNLLEPGDIDEALNAAAAIGDDRLQKQAQGYVVPDAFTHGSSAQRTRWFRRGYEQGRLNACDTFNADPL